MTTEKAKSESKAKDTAASSHVDVSKPNEVEYWAKELEVSTHILHDAVQKVGGLIADIRGHLKK